MISQAQLIEIEARLDRNRKARSLPEQYEQSPEVKEMTARVKRERELHNQIIDWANNQWPRVMIIHARMDQRSTIAVGSQDFTLFLPAGRTLCVECKAANKKPTTEQLAWHKQMSMLGHTVHLVSSFDEFRKLLPKKGES